MPSFIMLVPFTAGRFAPDRCSECTRSPLKAIGSRAVFLWCGLPVKTEQRRRVTDGKGNW